MVILLNESDFHDTGYYAIDPNGSEWWFQFTPSKVKLGNKICWDSSSGFINALERGSIAKFFYRRLCSNEILKVERRGDFRNTSFFCYLAYSTVDYSSLGSYFLKKIINSFKLSNSYITFDGIRALIHSEKPTFVDSSWISTGNMKLLNIEYFNSTSFGKTLLSTLSEDNFLHLKLDASGILVSKLLQG